LIPGLPKLNPGLELANTFGVNIWSGKRSCRFVTKEGSDPDTTKSREALPS